MEVVCEDKNFSKEETAGFVTSGFPRPCLDSVLWDSGLGKWRAAVVPDSVFEERTMSLAG